ncbi:MAG: sugar ABC transporter substrate-binding protein [bacterium]|nr:sugar ABC transporter substrate-binding protein [bacterium]
MKSVLKFFSLFVLVSLLGSCGGTGTSKGKITITYFARATTDQLAIWEKVIDNFMKENPDIRVKIENVPYQEYWSKLLTMAAAGTTPDVIFMESTRLPAFVEKESLLAFDGLIKNDKDIKLRDFYPMALDISRYKGKIYGLPNDLAIIALYYNKDAFDLAGLPYPGPNWTWKDLVAAGKKLTLDKNKDGQPEQYGITHYSWDIAIYQNGGDVVDNPLNPKRSAFQTARVMEALNFCRDLGFKHKITPPPVQQQYRSVYEMFTTGYAAMTMDGHWMIPNYRKSIKGFRWDCVVLPKGRKKAGLAYGSCFSIPRASKNPEAAWKLIKYLAGYQGQQVLIADGFSVPALKTIADTQLYLAPPPENQRAFLDMIPAGHLKPQTEYLMQMEDIWRSKLDLFWLNKASANEVCREIDEEVNKVLKGVKK